MSSRASGTFFFLIAPRPDLVILALLLRHSGYQAHFRGIAGILVQPNRNLFFLRTNGDMEVAGSNPARLAVIENR